MAEPAKQEVDTMLSVAKKPPKSEPEPEGESPKRYPSRENTRYVAVPVHIHNALKEYAKQHSDADEKKSASWAARRLLREGLERAGVHPKPPAADDDAD